jgi:transcriptional regulator with XRE-family HTH domain
MSNASKALADLLAVSRLSIAGLARAAGVSRASVSEYVHGHRQPGVGQLERLAAAAGRRAEITFPLAWDRRQQELEDVLALADALPLRPQPPRTRTWAEISAR